MTSVFPFGFPLPTAFYLTLFVLTLSIHVVFMNYVLAGSVYLAFVSLPLWKPTTTGRPRYDGPIALLLRDWMPFAVSAAITAAVAPLLFLQILYKRQFYTANLLLFHRWMAIVPVLIIGFYLAYLLKARRVTNWPAWGRAAVGLGMLLCFGFTAYSWTENHLLSMEKQETWSAFYKSSAIIYRNAQILPRLGIWVCGAFATMATMVAWQLWSHERHHTPAPGIAPGTTPGAASIRAEPAAVRTLSVIAIGGLLAAGVSGLIYLTMKDTAVADGTPAWTWVVSPMALPFSIAAAIGAAIQIVGWGLMYRTAHLCPRRLSIISGGCVLAIISASGVREVIRIHSVDFAGLYPQHEHAAHIGGLSVFLVFAAINAGLITWCFRLVKRGRVGVSQARS